MLELMPVVVPGLMEDAVWDRNMVNYFILLNDRNAMLSQPTMTETEVCPRRGCVQHVSSLVVFFTSVFHCSAGEVE
jgi:hypothetical protein